MQRFERGLVGNVVLIASTTRLLSRTLDGVKLDDICMATSVEYEDKVFHTHIQYIPTLFILYEFFLRCIQLIAIYLYSIYTKIKKG